MKPLTYDDLFSAMEKMKESEVKPRTFIFHPTYIAWLKRTDYIRREGGKLFLTNLPYSFLNGAEVFSSEYVPTTHAGFEVSKVIYDEFEENEDGKV